MCADVKTIFRKTKTGFIAASKLNLEYKQQNLEKYCFSFI